MKENEPLLKEEKDSLNIVEDAMEKVSEPSIDNEVYKNVMTSEKTEFNNYESESLENNRTVEEEKDKGLSLVPVVNKKKFDIKKVFEKHSKKELIITTVLTLIVLYFFGRVCYGYYLGFRYWEYEPVENNNATNVESNNQDNIDISKDVEIDEPINAEDSYFRFKSDICINNKELIANFYANRKVEKEELTIGEVGIIVFNNIRELSKCTGEEVIVEFATVARLIDELFADINYLEELKNITEADFGVYHVRYDHATKLFRVRTNNCDICNDMEYTESLVENIEKDGSHIYIYERFGYIRMNESGTHNIYSDGLGENLVSTFNKDIDGLTPEKLHLYKWTLKRGENNTYYFVSIEPFNK